MFDRTPQALPGGSPASEIQPCCVPVLLSPLAFLAFSLPVPRSDGGERRCGRGSCTTCFDGCCHGTSWHFSQSRNGMGLLFGYLQTFASLWSVEIAGQTDSFVIARGCGRLGRALLEEQSGSEGLDMELSEFAFLIFFIRVLDASLA